MSYPLYPPFYLVWNPKGREPARQHSNENTAREEAMRLARLCPGQEFYVLVPLSVTTYTETTTHNFAQTKP